MKIVFKTEGGVAHFPGLSRPVIIDSGTLLPADAQALEALVQAARFFDLPPTVGAPPRGAADYQRHTLTIEGGDRTHTVQIVEPIPNQELANLVDFVKAKVRDARTRG